MSVKLMSVDRSGLCSLQHTYQYVHCIDFVWPSRVSFYPVKYVLTLFSLITLGVIFCHEDGRNFLWNITCNFSVDFTLHLSHIL